MDNFSLTDIDNNGFLDQNDFECMAVRAAVIEGKGECNQSKLSDYQHIMRSLWDEISDLADFDKVCLTLMTSKLGSLLNVYPFVGRSHQQ